ncbi:FMN-dependent NADH-azoreductase [Aurantiacibacter gangjinensis]|uniref:FMN dependent NADH:quinone oxidoreductase n=1 Tax=Aurantiacibacter gangjinensis TaxID=502682 RepID=A0A0G9MRQ5_9SPHN|nr:NAD(P)H-dependent oxidoreductase [Aurantiacibacter gangjinensis]APE28078.1 FMN-dependent NADH-azoreductase [Aurantiacibacter gangjinensis]KLE32003.1 FMN-dependent NADH-azoreductase [Aurantiacibacter gangjinensis]
MSKILHITASINGEESVSRQLSTKLVSELAKRDGAYIVERDLSANDLPFIDSGRFAANLAPYAERSPEQHELAAIADTLIGELQDADTIVLGVPIYNFAVPATVKAWADLVARAGTTFKYTPEGPVGLLQGKRAYIAVASGGVKTDSEADFMTPWLKFFLGFLGITDVSVVAADALMAGDADAIIAEAHEKAAALAA